VVVLTPEDDKQSNAGRKLIEAIVLFRMLGAQQTAPGGRIVRTIGIVRARAKIGLENLLYNIRRLVTLETLGVAEGRSPSAASRKGRRADTAGREGGHITLKIPGIRRPRGTS
jgi:hypothetical protein